MLVIVIDFISVARQVGNNLIVPGGARQIDARGKFVMPGRNPCSS